MTAAEVRHLLAPGAALPGALSATATVRSRLLDEILLEVKDLRLAKLEELSSFDGRRIFKVEVWLEPDFTEKTELTFRLIIAADGELLRKKTTEIRPAR